MFPQPFELVSRLSPPPRDFNAIAWVNVAVVVLFFGLLGSRFVLAPGQLMELPTMAPASLTAVETSVVVNYRRDDVILFGAGMYSLADIKTPLEEYARKHPGATLQVNADKQVSAEALFKLGDVAASAGFTRMLVSGKSRPADSPQK